MLQNKGKNVKDNSLELLSDTGVLFSRTEKVTTALYMVTDCMSDTEPIRHQLRSLSVALVSLVRSTALKNQFETHFTTTEITHTIDEILSFLTMAVTLGFISIMNYEVLYREFDKIRTACIDRQHKAPILGLADEFGRDKRTTNFVLSPDFFTDKNIHQSKKHNYFLKDTKGHENNIKGQQTPIVENENKSVNQSDINQTNHLDQRNQKIIDFIKSKGQSISIKDIAESITDCSEKTIQRSLIALVESGILNRTGEKRWARYGINGQ